MWNFARRAVAAVAALSSLSSANQSITNSIRQTSNTTASFEIDIIFPLNETYKATSNFPIAIAVQNFSSLRTLGRFTLSWDIMPYSRGDVPGGITYDDGEFNVTSPSQAIDLGGDTFVFVANSNVSGWIGEKRRDERYMLNWHVQWWDFRDRCGSENTGVFGNLMFSVEAPSEEGRDWQIPEHGHGVAPDVMKLSECPVLGSVVDILPNATMPGCSFVQGEFSARTGTPCAVKVDGPVKSGIASRAAELAKPKSTSTSTSSGPQSTNAVERVLVSSQFAVTAVVIVVYHLISLV